MPEPVRASPATLTRLDAEDFLFHEAMLIDDRRFDEWLELFTDDGLYWVPAGDGGADPNRHVSIIYDFARERAWRVERLLHRHNWSQDPPARTAHVVSNVVVARGAGGAFDVRSTQLVCVTRMEETTLLPGRCTHTLVATAGGWRMACKKVVLLGADQYLMPDTITLL